MVQGGSKIREAYLIFQDFFADAETVFAAQHLHPMDLPSLNLYSMHRTEIN
jgi:hypothetical protein